MLSNRPKTPSAFIEEMKTTDFSLSRSASASDDVSSGPDRLFSSFDAFLDRMPAWIFHGLGGVAALIALWFALAYIGGFPRDAVEWITLAMFGGFAYAVGFMIPLVVAYLVETRNRLLMAALVTGGGAVFGVMSLSVSF